MRLISGYLSRVALALICVGPAWMSGGCTAATAYGTLGYGAPRVSRFLVEPAGKCDGPLHSYSYKMCCEVQVLIDEGIRSTRELRDYLKLYGGRGRVRAIGARHSSNAQICVESAEDRVLRLSSLTLDPDYEAVKVTQTTGPDGTRVFVADVDAGLTLARVNEILSEKRVTLGFGSVFFRGVTVAGALATGAHGSSLNEPAVLSARLLGVTLVDADGALREFTPSSTAAAPDLWAALQTHMGLLGIITRVKLRVEPDFWAHVSTDHHHERGLWREGGVRRVLDGCEWGQIVWYPRSHHYLRQCGRRSNPPKDARDCREKLENGLLAPYATPWMTNIFKKYMQDRRRRDRCWLEDASFGSRKRHPTLRTVEPHSVDRRQFRWETEATDRPHLLASSDVSRFQDAIPQLDFEVAVPLERADAAIQHVRERVREDRMCLPLIGVFLRFSAAAQTGLVAHSNHGKDGGAVMFLEIVVYAADGWRLEGEELRPYLALVSDLIVKFGGQAHWGKNHASIFRDQLRQRPAYAARVARFAEIARCVDPRGVFATPFARAVGLRGVVGAPAPSCAAVESALAASVPR